MSKTRQTIGRFLLTGPLILASAGVATAACYADYKAKQDDPLQLHYGVIALSEEACENERAAASEVAERIASEGWMLLNVVSTFEESGLEERQESAGEFYLRF